MKRIQLKFQAFAQALEDLGKKKKFNISDIKCHGFSCSTQRAAKVFHKNFQFA